MLILHASEDILKIFQVKIQQYVNQELLDVQVGFRKGRGSRENCQHLWNNIESKGIAEKKTTSASLTILKPLITTNWTSLKEMGIPDHLPCLLRNLYAGQEVTVRS